VKDRAHVRVGRAVVLACLGAIAVGMWCAPAMAADPADYACQGTGSTLNMHGYTDGSPSFTWHIPSEWRSNDPSPQTGSFTGSGDLVCQIAPDPTPVQVRATISGRYTSQLCDTGAAPITMTGTLTLTPSGGAGPVSTSVTLADTGEFSQKTSPPYSDEQYGSRLLVDLGSGQRGTLQATFSMYDYMAKDTPSYPCSGEAITRLQIDGGSWDRPGAGPTVGRPRTRCVRASRGHRLKEPS
jgi:hypothetical protein